MNNFKYDDEQCNIYNTNEKLFLNKVKLLNKHLKSIIAKKNKNLVSFFLFILFFIFYLNKSIIKQNGL